MDKPDNEDAAVEHVVDRLTEAFPDIPEPTVRDVVAELHESFEDAVVRDYVPVIIEHEAKDILRDGDPTQPPAD